MSKRLLYSCLQPAFAKDGTQSFLAANGVQSVGITTAFNLEQVFELGQLNIYENIEQIPDVEVTMEKVLDGYPLLYHLATNGATNGSLIGRSNVKTEFALSIFPDTLESASGQPDAEVHCSGMYGSASTFTFPVEGSCTESLTLVGNSKIWKIMSQSDVATASGVFLDNLDQPAAITGSGGVQRREDVLFAPASGSPTGLDENGATKAWMTVLPTDIPGVTNSGTLTSQSDGTLNVPVQSITVSVDMGRTPINQLGRKSYYHRYINLPVEVRTEIEVLATKWDGISADEAGGHNGAAAGSNLKNQTIRVRARDGTMLDLGIRNKLTNVSWSGGDAASGGSNVTNRYSYVNYNTYNVTHPADPSAIAP